MESNKISLKDAYAEYAAAVSLDDHKSVLNKVQGLSLDYIKRFLLKTGCYEFGARFDFANNKFKKVLFPEAFWQSSIPINQGERLFNEPIGEELLFGFFSSAENYEESLIRMIFQYNPPSFIKVVKLTRSFLDDKLIQHLSFLEKDRISETRRFYKEIVSIHKLHQSWLEKKIYYDTVLNRFTIQEILIHTTCYYEKYKRASTEVRNNKSAQWSKEVALCDTLNFMLNLKLASGHVDEEKIDSFDFAKKLSTELPPLNTPEGLARGIYLVEESQSQEKSILREAIDFYFNYLHYFLYQIDKYCAGYASVEMIDDDFIEFETNATYSIFLKNDLKNKHKEYYYFNQATKLNDSIMQEIEANGYASLEIAISSLTSSLINADAGLGGLKSISGFSAEELNTVLTTFSKWMIPSGRNIVYHKEESTEEGTWITPITTFAKVPEKFSEYFEPGYITVTNAEIMSEGICSYFNLDIEVADSITKYLIHDLENDTKRDVNFMENPLLKIGPDIYWLSSFLKDRNWQSIMFRRILSAQHVKISQTAERNIAKMLNDKGFSAKPSVRYKMDGDIQEIDVVAYKDGHLFVFELKTTSATEDILRINSYESRRFEFKAANQLEKFVHYVNDSFEALKNFHPELNIDRPLEEIHVHTFILSNMFDSDEKYYRNQHYKLSIFELKVILENNQLDILNIELGKFFPGHFDDENFAIPFSRFQELTGTLRLNKTDYNHSQTLADAELFLGNEIVPEVFLMIIKTGRIWKFLEKAYHLDVNSVFYITNADKIKPFFE